MINEPLNPAGPDESHTTPPEAEDLLPEYCCYRDEGCELASSCLECPFESCIEDRPRPWSRWKQSLAGRDSEILRLHFRDKLSIKELATRFRIGASTVKRILKEAAARQPGEERK